jgi:hypothetical protein
MDLSIEDIFELDNDYAEAVLHNSQSIMELEEAAGFLDGLSLNELGEFPSTCPNEGDGECSAAISESPGMATFGSNSTAPRHAYLEIIE